MYAEAEGGGVPPCPSAAPPLRSHRRPAEPLSSRTLVVAERALSALAGRWARSPNPPLWDRQFDDRFPGLRILHKPGAVQIGIRHLAVGEHVIEFPGDHDTQDVIHIRGVIAYLEELERQPA